ncbi:DUF2281 domain-containing protein [Ancylothrix sp. C2]|uniref:DUF2281 domain-containing protein n=1 Tax=Ancylothrix sp. D3o TaxID=2953691 RepID=UPI0021BA5234|nr:DUF2281 domain-containing protein [Ancylothrix sp. D3o]MCT7949967.1 DUF2281 domain-containing protein [Ancylothrix sp. D3o]
MKVKGIKQGKIIEMYEEINIADGSEIVIEIEGVYEKKRWPAKAGNAKGLIEISEDFDEPVEEFKD